MEDIKDWKKRLSKLLREHPGLGTASGSVEINFAKDVGITTVYRIEKDKDKDGTIITKKRELK